MKIIKNSHNRGGIGTETKEAVRYYLRHPKKKLVLFHQDPTNEHEPSTPMPNITTHYMLSGYHENVLEGVSSVDDLRTKYDRQIEMMAGLMEMENPHLVNCVGTFYYPWLMLNAAQRANKPFVVRYAGVIEKETNNPLWHEMAKDFISPDIPYLFPSELVKKTVETIHNTTLPNYIISPNGVDDVFLNAQTRKEDHSEFRIGFVGRMAKVKNPEYCAKLKNRLDSEGIRTKMTCVTDAGLNGGEYKAKTTRELIDAGIYIHKLMDHPELSQFYADCDLVISPSRFETFGNVPLEAIAAGTPALVAQTMGAKEAMNTLGLKDFIVDFDNMDDIVSRIKEIKKEKPRMQIETKEQIRSEYSWTSIFNKRHEFYKQLITQSKNI